MIGEMLLGILIFAAIIAVCIGIGYLLFEGLDGFVVGAACFVGCLIGVVVGLFLPCNMQGAFYSCLGALIVAILLGLLIWLICDRFEFYEVIAVIGAIVVFIGSFAGFWYLHLCNTEQDPYSRNIVKIEDPVVEQYRYEVLGGSDTTRISGTITGVRYIRGNVSEGDYYKIYYAKKDENGEMIAVPITVSEKATTVVLMPDAEAGPEYLLETVEKYYKENRNVEPAELILDKTVYTYRLYVREDTFNGIKLDGD